MLNFLKKFSKNSANLSQNLSANLKQKISKESVEERLLEADVSYEIVEEILYYLPAGESVKFEDLKRVLKTYFLYEMPPNAEISPFVELIIGVNGAGKTTTIAKLAHLYKTQGKSVILGACDTFRAGAIEQLRLWAEKIGVDIVSSAQGHDPSAVAFDTISKALSKGHSRVILDSAGRLQNQKNLAAELEKIARISNKAMQGAPQRKILIIDGTQGNAAILQAKAFNEIMKINGVIITKLDGTARGGSLFAVARELELPILYIGTGEKMTDLSAFDADKFTQSVAEWVFTDS